MRLFIIILVTLLSCSSKAFSQNTHLLAADQLFTAPENYNGQLSPDGKYFSFINTENNEDGLEFVELSNLTVTRAIELSSNLSLNSYEWLSKDVLLLQVSQFNERLQYIVTLYEKEKDEGKLLKSRFQELSDGYVVSVLEDGSDQLLFARIDNSRQDKRQTLYKLSVEQLKANSFLKSQSIERAPSDLLIYSFDKSVDRLLGLFFDDDDAEVDIKYKALGSDDWTTLFAFNDKDFTMQPIGFIDQSTFAVLTDNEADRVGLYEFDIRSQKIGRLIFEHEDFDLVGAELSEDGELKAIQYIENGLLRTDWKSSISQKIAEQFSEALKSGSTQIISISADQKHLLVFESGPNNPGKYYLYDSDKRELVHLVSLYPELDDIVYPSHEVLKVTTADGIDIEAYLTTPNTIDHNTLLVMPHGGPIGIRDYNTFDKDVQYFANRGFSILRVNYRGSSGFGKAFKEKGVGEFGKQIEADISAVVDDLLSRESFKNVCAMGSSYGAYSSVMLAIERPKLYSCVVATYGVYDLPLLFNISNYRSGKDFEEFIGKTVGENTQENRNYSPFYRVDEIQTPLLLIAGKKDDTAEFEQTDRMRYVLKKLDKEFDYLFYNEVAHGQTTQYGRAQESAYIANFLLNTLGLSWPNETQLSEKEIQALGDDYERIADIFASKKIEKKSDEQFSFYQQASNFGDGRSSFNLATFYQNGQEVEKSMDKAIELYEKSAEQGFTEAHYRLSQIYMLSDDIERQPENAISHIQTFLALEPDSNKGKLDLARLYCTNQAPIGDTDKCLSMFSEYEEQAKSLSIGVIFYRNLSRAIVEGHFSPAQRTNMTNMAIDMMNIAHTDFEVDIKKEGVFFDEEKGALLSLPLSDNIETVQEALDKNYKNVYVSAEFQADHPGLSSSSEYVFAVGVFQRIDETGTLVSTEFDYARRTGRGLINFYYNIDESKSGYTYVLSVYSVDGELKYRRQY